jgi:hypothetical protein
MDFIVRQISSRPDTMLVRYDCECGCKPNAEYKQGAGEIGHEHCCCGNVHFVGPGARQALEGYLAERKTRGEDAERGEYAISETSVADPWGGQVPVAYGIPSKHSH